ncbi:hypothetical protein [Rossellomorea vietnamensis]|uniref:Uncharacterized protein n=1 Tax=Rossellomorea vietnamensis TaxID=218284 RepID=A0A0P6W521_9BACI|nr:hypothetical protein [Rossellomorea vietnamensis]KPL60822.1 hypothetical protein AM506_03530 [Rossellomorea vietnamensis]
MIYLFSLLALILLLPILYFIPIGISNKGKLLIAGVSFGLTLLGLVASTLYPMWAIGLMLLALLTILSFMMEQRFGGLLAVAAGPDPDGNDSQWHEIHEQGVFKADLHNDIEVANEASKVKDEDEMVSVEELVDEVEPRDSKEEDTVHSEEATATLEDIEPLLEHDEILLGQVDTEIESTQVQQDESEWFIENANELNEVPDATEEDIGLFEGDLSEIESMINEPDETAVEEAEEPEICMEDIAEIIDESAGSVAEELEEPVIAGEDADLEGTVEEKEELLAGADSIDELPKRTRIMREVMKTMIEQITLSQSLLTTDQMENMIKHYLHPSLHDQDYYTFARILMDHYISTEQYEDLDMFIKGIQERFREYPYITMDLDQTKEYAWEMARN